MEGPNLDQDPKLYWETKKLESESNYYEAQARRQHAEADKAVAEAEFALVRANAERRADDLLKASDANNLVYRFVGSIDAESVNAAIYRLSAWSRMYPKQNIEIVFSSPGGNIVDGFALYDRIIQLRMDGHHVTTGTIGQAASMAGVLLQAGSTRWMGSEAWYLIHRAGFKTLGKTYQIEDEVELIKRFEGRIQNIFTSRSAITDEMIQEKWKRQDWWLDADESVELKLVDEVRRIPVSSTDQLTLGV